MTGIAPQYQCFISRELKNFKNESKTKVKSFNYLTETSLIESRLNAKKIGYENIISSLNFKQSFNHPNIYWSSKLKTPTNPNIINKNSGHTLVKSCSFLTNFSIPEIRLLSYRIGTQFIIQEYLQSKSHFYDGNRI